MTDKMYRHPNFNPTVICNKMIGLNKYITPQRRTQYKHQLGFSKRHEYMCGKNLIIKIKDKEYVYPPKSGFIIFNKNKKKLLIVKNRFSNVTSKWGLPKGHQEDNELPAECAERELFEETGIKLNIDMNITPTIKINNSLYYIIYNKSNIQFNVKPTDTTEIKEAKFQNISYIKRLNMNKELSIIITKKLRYIKNIAKKI